MLTLLPALAWENIKISFLKYLNENLEPDNIKELIWSLYQNYGSGQGNSLEREDLIKAIEKIDKTIEYVQSLNITLSDSTIGRIQLLKDRNDYYKIKADIADQELKDKIEKKQKDSINAWSRRGGGWD